MKKTMLLIALLFSFNCYSQTGKTDSVRYFFSKDGTLTTKVYYSDKPKPKKISKQYAKKSQPVIAE